MSLPPELRHIIKTALIKEDSNVYTRACRQIKTYLSVLNMRLDCGVASQQVLDAESEMTETMRMLAHFQHEATKYRT